MTMSLDLLRKDSNICRNHLVLEDIVRRRDKESWLTETSYELNETKRRKQGNK